MSFEPAYYNRSTLPGLDVDEVVASRAIVAPTVGLREAHQRLPRDRTKPGHPLRRQANRELFVMNEADVNR